MLRAISQPDTGPVLGFSQAVLNLPFRLNNVESMKVAAREAGARLLVTDGKGETEREIKNIDWLLAQKVSALIVSTLSGSEVEPAYWRAARKRVPLIIFASGLPDDDAPYTTFVGPDETATGSKAASYIGKLLGGRGRIVVVRGVLESSNSRLRHKGFVETLAHDFPLIEILAEPSCGWLRRPAQDSMVEMLGSFADIDAVFAENDEMALGVVDALRSWHRQTETVVVGVDGQREALHEISLGGPFAMTIKSQSDGRKAVETAIAAARGEAVPHEVILDAPMIDRDNVLEFLRKDSQAYAALQSPAITHLEAS